jgi:hypothetical protein
VAEEVGVAIDGLVLQLRPHPERADDLARVERLAGPGDDAGAVEVDDAVGEHLGVDAEVAHPAVAQQRADRVRHRADADLEAAAVLDLGDQRRDGAVGFGGRQVRDLRRRPVVARDPVVDLALVGRVLHALQARQAGRLLDDHDPRALGDGAVPQRGEAEVVEAVLVPRARLEHRNVRRVVKRR